MARRRLLISACAAAILIMASWSAARAGVATRRSHRVASGDSLWKIARAYQCSVDDLKRANRLAGSSIQPGQRLRIPSCKERERRLDDDEARRLEEVDGEVSEEEIEVADVEMRVVDATEIEAGRAEADRGGYAMAIDEGVRRRDEDRATVDEMVAVPLTGQSFGRPQNGYLVSGRRMPSNPKSYFLRRPERAWGADHTVNQIVRAIRQVRRRFPRVHPLAIGDLSARHGGRLTMHGSHQSGRDADIGFYFRKPPRGYPRGFAVARADNLDFRATWAFISTLCKTAEDALGVERIYMTYSTQALFYRLARRHGVPKAQLDAWFQYPRGRRADHGIIRHEPGHTEHIHVRFRCAPKDPECQ
jgi:murein endopeptidase